MRLDTLHDFPLPSNWIRREQCIEFRDLVHSAPKSKQLISEVNSWTLEIDWSMKGGESSIVALTM